jgi:hypothetical protein
METGCPLCGVGPDDECAMDCVSRDPNMVICSVTVPAGGPFDEFDPDMQVPIPKGTPLKDENGDVVGRVVEFEGVRDGMAVVRCYVPRDAVNDGAIGPYSIVEGGNDDV